MKVLITGVTGYIGQRLALKLASKKFSVHVLVNDLNSEKIPIHKNITAFEGDLFDYETILRAMDGCACVFHTAEYTNLKCKNIDDFYHGNVIGTQNVLKAALYLQLKKVIYTSTLAVYGPSLKEVPITELQPRLATYANDYELTKSMSEEVVLDYVNKGLSCVILNVARVYGSGFNAHSNGLNKLISKIANHDVLIVPSKLNIISNYVFIDDVINAHILAIRFGKSGEKYIIGGENVDFQKLFENIKDLTKSRTRILKVNYNLLKGLIKLISAINTLIRFNFSLTPKLMDSLFTNRSASSSKAESQLHYKMTPFLIGLGQTINFLNK